LRDKRGPWDVSAQDRCLPYMKVTGSRVMPESEAPAWCCVPYACLDAACHIVARLSQSWAKARLVACLCLLQPLNCWTWTPCTYAVSCAARLSTCKPCGKHCAYVCTITSLYALALRAGWLCNRMGRDVAHSWQLDLIMLHLMLTGQR